MASEAETAAPEPQTAPAATGDLTAAEVAEVKSAESATRAYLAAQEQVEVFVPTSITGVTRSGKPSDIYVGVNGIGFRLAGGRKHRVPKAIADLVEQRIQAEDRYRQEFGGHE